MLLVPLPVAPSAYNTTLSVPAVMLWLLVVLVVKVAAAPTPIKAMDATPSPPRTAIVLSFMMVYSLHSQCLPGCRSDRLCRCLPRSDPHSSVLAYPPAPPLLSCTRTNDPGTEQVLLSPGVHVVTMPVIALSGRLCAALAKRGVPPPDREQVDSAESDGGRTCDSRVRPEVASPIRHLPQIQSSRTTRPTPPLPNAIRLVTLTSPVMRSKGRIVTEARGSFSPEARR